MQRLYNFGALALQMVLVLFGILTALFFLIRLSGDPVAVMVGEHATAEDIAAIRAYLGIDRPLHEQYIEFLQRTAQLDFGKSIRFGAPAFQMVMDRFPATLRLTAIALVMTVVIALPVGVYAAVRRGRFDGRLIMVLAAVGQALPNFWFGILLILLFAVSLRWLPAFGSDEPRHLILPAIALASSYAARLARLVRSEMLEVLNQDYIRTAYAKGLGPRIVMFRHAFRNTLIPIVTVLMLDISILLGGSVVIESVFTYNGVGRLMVESIYARDYPVVQAAVFLIAVIVVVVTALSDISYKLIDPRVGKAS